MKNFDNVGGKECGSLAIGRDGLCWACSNEISRKRERADSWKREQAERAKYR